MKLKDNRCFSIRFQITGFVKSMKKKERRKRRRGGGRKRKEKKKRTGDFNLSKISGT